MEKEDKSEELIQNLKNIESLEEVPADISSRFHETLANLTLHDLKTKPKKNWLAGGNQFALAASITLVFALGAVFTFNSGGSTDDSLNMSQGEVSSASVDNKVKDDQLLYSAGEGSIPQTSDAPINLSNSAHDYVSVPIEFPRTLGVGNTWNSAIALEPSIVKCLSSLELDESTNLIDSGFLNGKIVKAIWTPVGPRSWNVYLINDSCIVIDKRFITQ
jgi:hypothetical protein